MAEQFTLSTDSQNDYYRYKDCERRAFDVFFQGNPTYKQLKLNEFYIAARQVVQSRDKEQLKPVVLYLRKSLELRENFSLRFHFAPLKQRIGHAVRSELIQYIVQITYGRNKLQGL